jgi:hypothetical protein
MHKYTRLSSCRLLMLAAQHPGGRIYAVTVLARGLCLYPFAVVARAGVYAGVPSADVEKQP